MMSNNRSQLEIGQPAPHFSALNDDNVCVHLPDLLQENGLLLAFIHGTWCSHCVQTLYRMRRSASVFTQAGIGIAVVAVDAPATLRIFRQSAYPAIPFTLLADEDESVHGAYGLAHTSGYIALDQSGVIRAVFPDHDHHSYPGHLPIIQALRTPE
ncbi:MAG: redoxin domain-containing protein [Anaerolineae bacterium]|nr:redoxin domain-containing protein [Anaerolineae bacterium]